VKNNPPRVGGAIPPPFGLLIVARYAQPFRLSEHKSKSEAISNFDILPLILLTHAKGMIEYIHDEGDDKTLTTRIQMITYRELNVLINKMTDEQLDCNVTVCLEDDELFPVNHLEINDADQEDDRLDDGHPVLIVFNENS